MEPIFNNELMKELVAFRKMLHANPEVSGKEYNTAKSVANFLKTCTPTKVIENIGGTGIVAVFDSKKPGKSVMFRAELDALPIQEINTSEQILPLFKMVCKSVLADFKSTPFQLIT